jgi:hypothetical protein
MKLLNDDGNDPLRWLLFRISVLRLALSPTDDGIDPMRLLLPRSSVTSLYIFAGSLILPNDEGISPLRWLVLRLLKPSASDDGIVPLSWLKLSSRLPRLRSFPREDGISPLNWLFLRSSHVREERLSIDVGIWPVRPISGIILKAIKYINIHLSDATAITFNTSLITTCYIRPIKYFWEPIDQYLAVCSRL